MIPPIEEVEAVVGYQFPGGRYTIEHYRNWLTNDVVGAPQPGDDVAHPMFCYYGALNQMGVTLDELFAMVGASADDGPMFGEAGIELVRPMRVGQSYDVRGEITKVSRKEGAKTGVFDILAFRLELVDGNGEVAAVSTNSFIFPRRP